MIGPLLRARSLFTRQPIRTQIWKKLCEKRVPPDPKDFLSKSIGGDPFYMVPFQIRNHMRFTIVFLLYFGIAFWAPPIVVHLQLYKRQLNAN